MSMEIAWQGLVYKVSGMEVKDTERVGCLELLGPHGGDITFKSGLYSI